MLKVGNDHFETTQREPKVDVCNRRYVFDAQPPANSPHPLVFNAIEKCPPFVVNPEIARRVPEKRRADELDPRDCLKQCASCPDLQRTGRRNKQGFPRTVSVQGDACESDAVCILPAAIATDPVGGQCWLVDEQIVGVPFSKPLCVMPPVPASHRAGAEGLVRSQRWLTEALVTGAPVTGAPVTEALGRFIDKPC